MLYIYIKKKRERKKDNTSSLFIQKTKHTKKREGKKELLTE